MLTARRERRDSSCVCVWIRGKVAIGDDRGLRIQDLRSELIGWIQPIRSDPVRIRSDANTRRIDLRSLRRVFACLSCCLVCGYADQTSPTRDGEFADFGEWPSRVWRYLVHSTSASTMPSSWASPALSPLQPLPGTPTRRALLRPNDGAQSAWSSYWGVSTPKALQPM